MGKDESELLERAIEIAVAAHRHQRQKNGLPYVLHPITLMLRVSSLKGKMVAVLHDVVEDSNWTLADLEREGFPQEILEALACLTHREGESYEEYIDRISQNPLAVEVKLADLQDNMDITRLPAPLSEKDWQRLQKYRLAWEKLKKIKS
ncbi:MAG: hypothetical protein NZ901_09025 [Geminocystis sp.]|nr:hypothetical protein [Geminocystis sp.]HIK37361.1 GTP pyrophosphokinase [Geminocystis sp. M7585_C2015_104]MCS7148318.1 hypothetical protein [Geminocystis sp.]MCX8077732.1 hypothetical protein [Geminocystis sp.]MDW8116624.1 hypothetical protein [Geminocystis sp.]